MRARIAKMKAWLVLAASAGALVAAAGPASAGGVTSPGPITDSIEWSQLGPATPFPNIQVIGAPVNVVTGLGNVVTVSSAGAGFERQDQGNGWGGNFAPGTPVLSTGFDGPDITLTFTTPVSGAGAQIQAFIFGPFTAQITVNGSQTFTESGLSTGAGDNSAIFIGWSGGPINTLEFSMAAASNYPNSFAIGPLDIFGAAAAPGPVPGAGLAGLAALALAGLYARTRRA